MTELCTNQYACTSFQQSYRRNLESCMGCNADIRGFRLMSNIADRLIDKALAFVENRSPEDVFHFMKNLAGEYIAEAGEHGFDVSFPEAAFALQLQSLFMINDLKAGLARGF